MQLLKTMALKYSFRFPKLEISPQELGVMIEGKTRAIWSGPLPRKMNRSVDEVTKSLGRRTNTTDRKSSDQRRGTANENFQEAGALPNQTTSPIEAQKQNPNYAQEVTNAYREDQTLLFDLLIENEYLETGITIAGSKLVKDGVALTCKETCNALDDATRKILNLAMAEGSITVGSAEREPLSKMNELCNKVAVKRLAVNGVFEDNLLDNDNNSGYKKWRNHVFMLASFTALMVSLKYKVEN